MDRYVRCAAISLLALMAFASSLCFTADHPALDLATATSPSTRLLEILKQALDNDQLLQESFFSEDNLKTFFDATSIQWLVKQGDRFNVGKVARIQIALIPAADIRASSLFVPGAPVARSISIHIHGVPLSREEVIAVFGMPVAWSRKAGSHADRIPLPLHFGDVEGVLKRPWDGIPAKGASFSVAHDGSINGIMILAIGPIAAVK
jgi:hypothetical protein